MSVDIRLILDGKHVFDENIGGGYKFSFEVFHNAVYFPERLGVKIADELRPYLKLALIDEISSDNPDTESREFMLLLSYFQACVDCPMAEISVT